MHRLLLAALVSCLPLGIPAAVRADDVVEYRLPSVRLPVLTAPERPRSAYLRPALYLLQLGDAVATSASLRRARTHETNPLLRPFTHGGLPTIVFGFALGDVVRDRMFRHASAATRDAADAGQAASNADGLMMTLHALHAP